MWHRVLGPELYVIQLDLLVSEQHFSLLSAVLASKALELLCPQKDPPQVPKVADNSGRFLSPSFSLPLSFSHTHTPACTRTHSTGGPVSNGSLP